MAGLLYIGKTPSASADVETRKDVETVLTGGVSRGYVDTRVATLSAAKATKVYTDTQDSQYATPDYYTSRDALLVPNSAKGAANGVASLDATTKVPDAQVPILGLGMVRGPIGPTSVDFSGTTGVTPLKIAQWDVGVIPVTSQLLAFAQCSVQSVGGRPVVEIRAGNSTQTTYASQTLIAMGYGDSFYNDFQMIHVTPVAANGEGQDGNQDAWAATTNLLVNMWLYDDGGGQSSIATGLIYTASLFLMRTAL
ncbi:hypothetical protein SEA_YASSIFIED_245 [Mycobacterium phage Yassified]|uniref:Uncharacterized protein n=1 Tax=Mycobacterium phage ET08 TaxID=663554 RepID=C9DB29_9CAUD|nr:minor tail protein [Mycobacterium phage ET08]ACU41447.1 hypothetical protein ET08_235 [Mycobacterium phage ET08]QAY13194.1 hypothetical protein SEA_BADAGARTUDE_243 [Mycobacterium phage BadAgartude]QKO02303.1 hypothetical protein SEA_RONAN_245 [Mycobacterium phage Ronan]WNT44812.1 hypothetical protein SEA_YASSIFIED_245 [Mycobacterium phage Yassified]